MNVWKTKKQQQIQLTHYILKVIKYKVTNLNRGEGDIYELLPTASQRLCLAVSEWQNESTVDLLELRPGTLLPSTPRGSIPKILADFNRHFESQSSFHVNYNTAATRFLAICRRFLMKWKSQPCQNEPQCLGLTVRKEQRKQTIKDCKECESYRPNLYDHFTTATKAKKVPLLKFTQKELKNPLHFGKKVLQKLNTVCNTHLQDTICIS